MILNHPNNYKRVSGSLTLEAAIILPIIIVIILFLVGLSLMQYEKVYLQGLANRIAREEAHCYMSSQDHHLYWRIHDDNKGNKLNNIKERIQNENVFLDEDTVIAVELKNGLIQDYLVIQIHKPFRLGIIPLGYIQVSSKSKIKDTAEMIRTYRLLDEYATKVPGYNMMKNRWVEIKEQVIQKMTSND